MSPEFWSIIAAGIAILIAIATSNRSLRREMNERITGVQRDLGERIAGVQRELGERINGLSDRIAGVQRDLGARIDGLSDRLGDVRERLGRIEGLLEGFGLLRRNRAGKGRDDERHSPVPPRS